MDLIYRVALPSVLEVIEDGIPSSNGAARSDAFRREASALQVGLQSELDIRRVKLSFQHRMHPEISRFPRDHVYQGEALQDADGLEIQRSWPHPYPRYSSRACWLDVQGTVEGKRIINPEEVDQLVQELEAFRRWCRAQPPPQDRGPEGRWRVAVLTFYVQQERALRYALQERFRGRQRHTFVDRDARLEVKVGTVDRFQGQEADIVFLSMVRTYPLGVGFLDNPNRVNVALTRARYQLVIIGNRNYFQRSHQTERAVLCRAAANELPGGIALARRGT